MSDSATPSNTNAPAPTTAPTVGPQLPGQRPFVVQSKSASDQAEKPSLSPKTITQMRQFDAGLMQALGLQAKLESGTPGDKYEQEADQVAAQVVAQINVLQAQPKSVQQPISNIRTFDTNTIFCTSDNTVIQRWDPGPLPNDDSRVPEPRDADAPIEVTVIDDSDIVGLLAAFTRTGEVYMTNVGSMVNNVLRALNQRQMTRLNILDHGNANCIEIGNDVIAMSNFDSYRTQLARLNGHFTPSGFVHIQHCEAGQNQRLVVGLAQTFGVPVYAGTGAHNPLYRFNLGDYVRGNPDGSFDSDVGRP